MQEHSWHNLSCKNVSSALCVTNVTPVSIHTVKKLFVKFRHYSPNLNLFCLIWYSLSNSAFVDKILIFFVQI